VVVSLAACVASILIGVSFNIRGRENNLALSLIDRAADGVTEIGLLARHFIQNADEASWAEMMRRMNATQDNLHGLLALTRNRPAEIEDLGAKVSDYQTLVNRLYAPVVSLREKKAALRRSGLSFSEEIETRIIDPIRVEEGLQIFNGRPVDPFKVRVKDEASGLLALYLKQQILLLDLIQDSDLGKYERERASIAADIARHESRLRYMEVLLGNDRAFQPVFDSLHRQITGLLGLERAITGAYVSILAINRDLSAADERLSAAKERLVEGINADIDREGGLNQLANALLLVGIVLFLAVFGILLARDVIRFVRTLEAAHRETRESELRFRTVIEQAADAIILADFSGAVIAANQRACELLGCPREELLARDLHDFTPAEPWPPIPTGAPLTVETVLQRGDGGEFPAEIRIGRILYGGQEAVLGIARDVTERKRAEEALQLSEENLRITLDSIGDGVIATDIHGRVTRMNRVAEQLTGFGLADARGRALREIFRIVDANDRRPVEDPVTRVLEEKRIVELANDTVLLSAAGREYRIADSGAPIRNDRGEIFGVVLIFRDTTEKYRLQQSLRRAEKMDAVGQLAGGIAHDFNNMLTGIIGTADLMAPLVSDRPDLKESVDLILDTATRAADLTRKLLSFSRKGKVISAPFDVHDCIGNALAILERSIDKTIVIERRFAAHPSLVTGDATQLENAFLNLGINARDAMPHGGRLRVETENVVLDEEYCRRSAFAPAPGRYIRIRVVDTGVGMDKLVLARLFEPFFTTKSGEKGTGLGLASVYGAVKEHNGDIHVDSEPGRGTAFSISLPAASGEGELSAPEQETVRPRGGRVLVVDDEEVVRATIERFLAGAGFEVVSAEDGARAVEIYGREKERIDVILLDLIMPRQSGKDTFYELRGLNPRARIIVSSGFAYDTNVMQLLADGAKSFIQKPYRFRELANIITQVLEGT
jgi:PAS domain S-box-containing protein